MFFWHQATCFMRLHCNKQSRLKPLWKNFILPVNMLTLLSSFITSHCTSSDWWITSTVRITAAYLSHGFIPTFTPLFFFFSVAFVKFLNSAHTELRFLPALGKELGMFYSKKKSTRELKQRKNLYRSRKEYYSPVGLDAKACIAQQKQKQIQREKKKRHFPNTLNLFIPRVGPHLPTNATALVNKKQSFLLTQFFFSSPLPKGIIFDYYWQVNLLHSMIPYNRKQYLVIHSCLLLSCLTVFLHQYLRCFLLLAV